MGLILRITWLLVGTILAAVVSPSTSLAQKRIALLIGNKDYKPGVGALVNPLNDVRLVSQALTSVGFEVLKPMQNATREAMLVAIHEFASKLKAAGPGAVGFLYYSGHGIASEGENYLIPLNVDEPSTLKLRVQAVKQSEVLSILRSEAPLAAHYLVLDACRHTLQGARGGKGFIPVGQQSGVLVAFSTEPGKTASDTGEGSGPYAAALAAELVRPDQSDLIMFHNVRVAVVEKTGGDQVPWTEDGIQRRERVRFGGEARLANPSPQAAPTCSGVLLTVGSKNELRCLRPGSGRSEWFIDCPSCPEMIVVPSGRFIMGSPKDEKDRDWNFRRLFGYEVAEEQQTTITISKPLAVARFPVTRGEFAAFASATNHQAVQGCAEGGFIYADKNWRNPGFDQNDRHPVVCISWGDANAFTAWLSKTTGKSYRLLSEAEREYVTRAGTTTRFWWGSSITPSQANFDNRVTNGQTGEVTGEFRGGTSEVEFFSANPWGLFDVHGNVWAWSGDCAIVQNDARPGDGTAVASPSCPTRAIRGGSWMRHAGSLRSAARDWREPPTGNVEVGFRVVRTLD